MNLMIDKIISKHSILSKKCHIQKESFFDLRGKLEVLRYILFLIISI